ASVLKEAIKRRKPDFSEGRYGFRAFGNLLEEAQARGLLEFGRDEKSGTYVYRSGAATRSESAVMEQAQTVESGVEVASVPAERRPSRRNGRGARKSVVDNVATAQSELEAAYAEHVAQSEFAARDEPLALPSAPIEHVEPIEPVETRRPPRRGRGERKPAVEQLAPVPDAVEAPAVPVPPVEAASPPVAKEERRRSRGSRQPKEQAPEAAASDVVAEAAATAPEARTETRRKGRGGRKTADQTTEVVPSESAASGEASAPPASAETAAKPARKPAARSRRPRKTEE
ncbi:MAG: NYN domain protein, partial [Zoogloea sp.]|nr:NYN domain protein [Zoogloea sp.]